MWEWSRGLLVQDILALIINLCRLEHVGQEFLDVGVVYISPIKLGLSLGGYYLFKFRGILLSIDLCIALLQIQGKQLFPFITGTIDVPEQKAQSQHSLFIGNLRVNKTEFKLIILIELQTVLSRQPVLMFMSYHQIDQFDRFVVPVTIFRFMANGDRFDLIGIMGQFKDEIGK